MFIFGLTFQMDRRYELAIDEKFERLVRESPRPRVSSLNENR